MNPNQSGPAIFIPNQFLDSKYMSIIDGMIDAKLLKPSFRMFFNAMNTLCLVPEAKLDDGCFIRFFDVCDMVNGTADPDYKADRVIKVTSKVTRYSRLKTLLKLNTLAEYPNKQRVKEFNQSYDTKPAKVYVLQYPCIDSNQDNANINQTEKNQFTSNYRQARKIEEMHALNMDFGYFAKPLEQLGSMDILATYFNDCIRASNGITSKLIKKEKKVRNPETGKIGTLFIQTTTSTAEDAEIMLGDDMVLLNYFYSSINERLISNLTDPTAPFQNLFRFDKRSILVDLGLTDSGGNRDTLDASVSRVVNTLFSLESDSEGLWLMQKLGLVDGNGHPYSKAPVRLIEEVGQTDDAEAVELDDLIKSRTSLRYFDIALPSFLERQINRSIQIWHESIAANTHQNLPTLKMFSRDKTLLLGQEKGLIWLINDHLSAKLARPGFSIGPVSLEAFLTAFNSSIITKTDVMTVKKLMFTSLHSQSFMLYCDEWHVNKRRQPRFMKLIAMLNHKFLLEIENVTPGYTLTTRISNLRYQFRVIRLTEAEIEECKERSALIQKNIEYAEDEAFVPFANAIFARAQATASKYR
ncbi:hypothetical protein [Paraglaciecola chathamensis]|nr:hypothetical protein [Paraglaciecola agarilytica]